jgi:hypothetical protein
MNWLLMGIDMLRLAGQLWLLLLLLLLTTPSASACRNQTDVRIISKVFCFQAENGNTRDAFCCSSPGY